VRSHLPLLLAALLIEAAFGYPDALFRAIRHPVVWAGALIAALDARLNGRGRGDRAAGVLAVLVVLLAAVVPAWLVQHALLALPGGWLVVALLAAALLAQRSLHAHVAAVGTALAREGLAGGRRAVARIVGRNPETLDEPGVVRAAIESLAENFSDAVVAPAFWCALFGLPGIAAYKALNTADSMIGHRTPRHAAFGWAAARLDDLVNLPAARLAALWLVLAAASLRGADARAAWRAAWRDAGRHRSPNAGWPEAAMAGALGLRLAGPRVYGTTRVADAWMGDGRAAATPADLSRALALYRRACAAQIAIAALLLAVSR
jgi:adenosylcobinamide-phosphate synthase